MLFTVCYEDWTVVDGVQWGQRPEGETLKRAQEQLKLDFEYLRDSYMSRQGFLRTEAEGTAGRPLLLCFGPRTLRETEDWESMLSTVFPEEATRPLILSLNGKIIPGGRFGWFPLLNRALSLSDIDGFLKNYYLAEAAAARLTIGPIWAGFRDYYVEGSAGKLKSYGHLPEHDGDTLQAAIDRAKIHRPAFVQLCTWNDWQEGTNFEPSKELGYSHLLKIQRDILGEADQAAFESATERYWESQIKMEIAIN
ncbi:unnamed protein product [Polarella glacialis]|uniref:Uncharacterized protein n=1 Tax=Polarella glacialis TaxID=89957 RepID=A0A813KMK9_POLGL|nr:unnamed protein product [Polarella glacialis]